jgi:hypothetical protein
MLCFERPSFIYQSLWYMSPLPGSPAGCLWREIPVSRAFLYITFRVPSKGAPPPGSPNRAPTERDAPFPKPSFNYLSKFTVNGLPPPRFPNGAPTERDTCFQSLLLHIHQKLTFPSKSLVQESPSMFPQQGWYRERCSISRANGLFFHLYLLESPN